MVRLKQVNFRTPEELYERIKLRALEQGKTISSYMNDLAIKDLEHADGYILATEKDMLLEVLKVVRKIDKKIE